MMDGDQDRALKQGYRTIQVIYFAILGSLIMYAVVGVVLSRTPIEVSPDFPADILVYGLTAAAALLTVAAWALRKALLQRVTSGPDDNSSQTTPVDRAVQSYRITILMVAAMAEAIGVFALVLVLLGGEQRVFFTFLGLSAAVMWLLGPKFAELQELAVRFDRASSGGEKRASDSDIAQ